MKRFISLFISAVLLLAAVGTASAVDFQEELKKMATENAKGYIGPLSTAFGTAMNSGLYHTAKPHGMLGFDISFKFAVVSVPDDAQTFDFVMPTVLFPISDPLIPVDTLELNGNILFPDRENPTVFGKNEVDPFSITAESVRAAFKAALVDGGSMTQDEFNLWADFIDWNAQLDEIPNMPRFPGIGFDALPFVMPQVSIGLIKKTEVMLRFMPKVKVNDDIGEAGFIGIGIKHNLDQWLPIPLFPVDISAQFVWQSLTIGDLLESNHKAFSIMASKKIGIGISITPYIGMGFESSTLDVKYEIENPNNNPMLPADGTEIDFSLDGDNSFRMSGGVRIGLPLITLNADYSIGEYKTYSLGLGFSLR